MSEIAELTDLLNALDQNDDKELIQQVKVKLSHELAGNVSEGNISQEQVLTEPEPAFKGSHEIT